MVQDVTNGLILINQSLVLQKVTRSAAGTYRCQAENTEGVGESNPLSLSVQFAPECEQGQVQVYGVGKHETARVRCQVYANPEENIKFYWRFNTSRETLDIQVGS